MDSYTRILEKTEYARSYIIMEKMSRHVPFTVIVMDVEFKPKLDHYNHIWSSHLDSELKMVVGMMIEIIKIDEFEFKIKGIVE